jgi:hypothetical protein
MRRFDVVSCSGVPPDRVLSQRPATKQTLWLIVSSPKRIEIFKRRDYDLNPMVERPERVVERRCAVWSLEIRTGAKASPESCDWDRTKKTEAGRVTMKKALWWVPIVGLMIGVGFAPAVAQEQVVAAGQVPGMVGAGTDEPDVQIPAGQRFFTTTHFTTAVAFPNFALIPGFVSHNNGTATRIVIIRFSADAYNSVANSSSVVRVSIDGGACRIIGPELFNFQHIGTATPRQARTWQGVVATGPGVHTYRMCGSAFGGGTVSWGFRTLTVEARTQ